MILRSARALRAAVVRRYFGAFITAALCAGALAACTDGESPSAPIGGDGPVRFSLMPRFHSLSSSSQVAPINFARLTVLHAVTRAPLAEPFLISLVPTDPEWDLGIEFTTPDGEPLQVVVVVELLNVTNGVETIEWSGITAPIGVTPGAPAAPPVEIEVFEGPPQNLSVTAVTIVNSSPTMVEGASVQFTAVAAGSSNVQIIWHSTNTEVATVDATGRVQALRGGIADIIAKAGPREDTVRVVVNGLPASVRITPDTARASSAGQQISFVAIVLDARNEPVNGETIIWSSSDNAVVTSAGNGSFTAVGNGTTTVLAQVASAPSIAASAVAVVAQRVATITLDVGTFDMTAIGDRRQFVATAKDALGNTIANAALQWSSSNTSAVTVDATGLAVGVGAGSAIITARSSDGPTATATVNVLQASSTITIEPTALTIPSIGDTARLTAVVRDRNNNVVNGAVVTWSSADANVATVDATGRVTATGRGSVVITASAGAATATARITINQTVTSIVASPDPLILYGINAVGVITAVATDAGGRVVNDAQLTWTSLDPAVISVDGGRITINGYGEGRVVVSAGTAADTVVVRVEVPSLQITSGDVQFATIGQTRQLEAFGTRPDGSNGIVNATWFSTDTTVARVSSLGMLTAAGAGTASVIASANGVADTITVTVSAGANIRISSVRTLPSDSVAVGDSVTVYVDGRNSGVTPLAPMEMAITAVDGETNGPIVQTIIMTPPLAPGDTLSLSFRYPVSNQIAWPQYARIVATADPANSIVEFNEGDNMAASAPVRVITPVFDFVLAEDTLHLDVSQTANLTAMNNGVPVTPMYRSTHEAVATVDANGVISAAANGYARIIAAYNGDADTTFVQVGPGVPLPGAAVKMWLGTADAMATQFNDPANWMPRGVPGASDNIYIPDCNVFSALLTPTYNGASRGCTAQLQNNVQVAGVYTGYNFYDDNDCNCEIVQPAPGSAFALARMPSSNLREAGRVMDPTSDEEVLSERKAAQMAAFRNARTARLGAPAARAARSPAMGARQGGTRDGADNAGGAALMMMEQSEYHIDLGAYELRASGYIEYLHIGSLIDVPTARLILNGAAQTVEGIYSYSTVVFAGANTTLSSDEACGYYCWWGVDVSGGNVIITGDVTMTHDSYIYAWERYNPDQANYVGGDFSITGDVSMAGYAFVYGRNIDVQGATISLVEGADLETDEDLVLRDNAFLDVGPSSYVEIEGDLSVTSGARFSMRANSYFDVEGDALIDGASTEGYLTGGYLYFYGNLTVGTSNPGAFAPSVDHTTDFGQNNHTLVMPDAGPGAGQNHFHHVEFFGSENLQSSEPIFVNGNGYFCHTGGLTAPSVTVAGEFNLCGDDDGWNVPFLYLTGSGVVPIRTLLGGYEDLGAIAGDVIIRGPRHIYDMELTGNLVVDGVGARAVIDSNGEVMSVTGNVDVINGGVVSTIDCATFEVGGTFTTSTGAAVDFNACSDVIVHGDVTLGGGPSHNAAEMVLHGNLIAGIDQFFAESNQKITMVGGEHLVNLAPGNQPGVFVVSGSTVILQSDLSLLTRFEGTDGIVMSASPRYVRSPLGVIVDTVNFSNVRLEAEYAANEPYAVAGLSFTGFAANSGPQLILRMVGVTRDFYDVSFDTGAHPQGHFVVLQGDNAIARFFNPTPSDKTEHSGRFLVNGANSFILWPADMGG